MPTNTVRLTEEMMSNVLQGKNNMNPWNIKKQQQQQKTHSHWDEFYKYVSGYFAAALLWSVLISGEAMWRDWLV